MSIISSPTETPAASPSSPRAHLQYLDGMRGLAAFYVVLHHLRLFLNDRSEAKTFAWWHAATSWLQFGHFAVVVFIALSGYCLMLPVVRSDQTHLVGSVLDYLKRRARRILPPYYAALLFSLILIATVPGLNHPFCQFWAIHVPAFTPGVILSHVFLIHNLSNAWVYKINAPLWSVATEWQIYFAFPLLLVLRRRFGLFGMATVAVVVGCLPQFVLHKRIDQACLHFLSIFAFGMVGAAIGFSSKPSEIALRTRLSWIAISIVCWTALAICIYFLHFDRSPLWDCVAGLATVALLIHCTRFLTEGLGERPRLLKFFEASPLVKLGSFSYSLYLVHSVIIGSIDSLLVRAHVPFLTTVLLLFVVGVPLVLAVSYAFHLAFEKPFMKSAKAAPKINLV